jgi:hypothetical protein
MLNLKLFVFVSCIFYTTNASILDPCRLIKCDKPLVACLEAIPNSKCLSENSSPLYKIKLILKSYFSRKLWLPLLDEMHQLEHNPSADRTHRRTEHRVQAAERQLRLLQRVQTRADRQAGRQCVLPVGLHERRHLLLGHQPTVLHNYHKHGRLQQFATLRNLKFKQIINSLTVNFSFSASNSLASHSFRARDANCTAPATIRTQTPTTTRTRTTTAGTTCAACTTIAT